MRSVFTILASGVVLVLISSCATVPTEPLKPGELRLQRMEVEGNPSLNIVSKVKVSFEADGKPEIRRACFTWSGDDRSCFKVSQVEYGSPGTFFVWLTPRRPGMFVLECYAEYTREGKAYPSNKVAAQTTVAPF
jgi:hypothetical protein